MSRENPRFDIINKYQVSILSLRNQLKTANSLDELTIIASKIIELEQQILVEKSAGVAQMESEKKQISIHIDKLRRELKQAENDLNRITDKLDLKVNGYRKALQSKIEALTAEYNELILKD